MKIMRCLAAPPKMKIEKKVSDLFTKGGFLSKKRGKKGEQRTYIYVYVIYMEAVQPGREERMHPIEMDVSLHV
jgi:hypothetical protein